MTVVQSRWLSTAEAAQALGLTPKALRLYERKGLVRPQRTAAGWRAYGPEALARLHQVVALKGLGLSLTRIGELLQGRLADLDAVLALQERALHARKAEAERGLRLLRAARARLEAGEALSVDDLTTLTKETTMDPKLSDEEWREVFDPLARRHFSPEDLAEFGERKRELLRAGEWDQAGYQQAWDSLIAEGNRLQDPHGPNLGDPSTPAAMDLAARWMAMVEQFDQGDPSIRAKSAALWTEALGDPVASARMPFGKELWAFVEAANAARSGRSNAPGDGAPPIMTPN